MSAKIYQGRRIPGSAAVAVNNQPLNPRLDLREHSPTGFEWGYGGSGPAQLALAILADHTGHAELTLANYQQFKWDRIAQIQETTWTMTGPEVQAWLDESSDEPI